MTKPKKEIILNKHFECVGHNFIPNATTNALLALADRATSCPLKKALIMLFRGEMSERICSARTMTENNVHLTLFENGLRVDRR